MTDGNQRSAPAPSHEAEVSTYEMDIDGVATLSDELIANVETVILGKRQAIEHVVTTILARGHVLLEDVPGTGKTMLARAIATSIDGTFRRVQFTPDLLPTDITGITVYNQRAEDFEFQPGPVFANVVLGDEINRAPPKTQSALLEAMEEHQVTVDGTTRKLPDPFFVIATQNTVEPNRTYELPIAEVDRFMKQLELGYPDEHEPDMLARVVEEHPIESVEPVTSIDDLIAARSRVGGITVTEPVREYTSDLVAFTRRNANLGASPRATIDLVRAAQARAAISGRDYVIPDDIQLEATVVLPHRIHVADDPEGPDRTELVETALESVAIP